MKNISSFDTVPEGKVFLQFHDSYWGGEHPHNNFRYGFLEYVNQNEKRLYRMDEMKMFDCVRIASIGTCDGSQLPKDGCLIDEGEVVCLEMVNCFRDGWRMVTIISDPFAVTNRGGRACRIGIPSIGRWLGEQLGKRQVQVRPPEQIPAKGS